MEFLGTKKRRFANPRAETPAPAAAERPGGLRPRDIARCPRGSPRAAPAAAGEALPPGPRLRRSAAGFAGGSSAPAAAGAGPLLLCDGGEAPLRAGLRSAPGLAGGRGAG